MSFPQLLIDLCFFLWLLFNNTLGVPKGTLLRFYSRLDEIICNDLDRPRLQLGGKNVNVEVNDSYFVEIEFVKYRKIVKKKYWVIGITEENSDFCFYQVST